MLGVVTALHPIPRLELDESVLPKDDIDSRREEGVAEVEFGERLAGGERLVEGGETAPGIAMATPEVEG